jgi:hypothetical protein
LAFGDAKFPSDFNYMGGGHVSDHFQVKKWCAAARQIFHSAFQIWPEGPKDRVLEPKKAAQDASTLRGFIPNWWNTP